MDSGGGSKTAIGILLLLVAAWLIVNTVTGNLQTWIGNLAGWNFSGSPTVNNPPPGTGSTGNSSNPGNQAQGSGNTGVPSETSPPVVTPGTPHSPIVQPTQP